MAANIDVKEAQDKIASEVTSIIKKLNEVLPEGLTRGQAGSILQLYMEIYYA